MTQSYHTNTLYQRNFCSRIFEIIRKNLVVDERLFNAYKENYQIRILIEAISTIAQNLESLYYEKINKRLFRIS